MRKLNGVGSASPGCTWKLRPVDGAAVEARRRAGLEAAAAQAKLLQRFAQQDGGRFAGASRGILLLAAVDQAVEKRAGGDDDGGGADGAAIAEADAEDSLASVVGRRSLVGLPGFGSQFLSCRVPGARASLNAGRADDGFHNQIRHFRLLDFQIRLRFQHLAHLQAVGLLVALRARRPHRRAARGVQQAELDADRVGDFAHDAAQRVHFADQVSLGNAADGRIAGHLRDEIDVQGVERGLQAHAGRGHGGFASGVSGADHDYIELFGEVGHGKLSF